MTQFDNRGGCGLRGSQHKQADQSWLPEASENSRAANALEQPLGVGTPGVQTQHSQGPLGSDWTWMDSSSICHMPSGSDRHITHTKTSHKLTTHRGNMVEPKAK